MNKDINIFVYGYSVKIFKGTELLKVTLKFCQSNYSFIEFIDNDLKIIKSVFIYHMRNVKMKDGGNFIIIRMRNYDD